jgi:hypothetical protein
MGSLNDARAGTGCETERSQKSWDKNKGRCNIQLSVEGRTTSKYIIDKDSMSMRGSQANAFASYGEK